MRRNTLNNYLFLVLLLTFILIISQSASALWYFESDEVTIELIIESGVKLNRNGPDYYVEYLTADVSYIPLNLDHQEVLSLKLDPEANVADDGYAFRWEAPVPINPKYFVSSRIKKSAYKPKIKFTKFPNNNIPEDIKSYTWPATTIDSDDPKVMKQASDIVTGEDDYYEAVFKLADWTKNNVEYDLSTLTQKASQKASWVLDNKKGVCDELTTLFIAMARSVGIPARFVSGIAYTESPLFPENWGAHGWAEVYFPNVGWVPFDVTYGEYGFVDPTHIVLKYSIDSGESDTRYEWLARDTELVTLPINVSAKLISKKGKTKDHFSINLGAEQDVIGAGSYNLITAQVHNPTPNYISTFLYLSDIDEMEMLSKKGQAVLIKPYETTKVFWLVKVIDSIEQGYSYTFPVGVVTPLNTTTESAFTVVSGATVFSKNDMQRVIDANKKESDTKFSKSISIDCETDKDTYYTYNNPNINCSIKNMGNFPFENLKVCFEKDCTRNDLLISEEKSFEYDIVNPIHGARKIMFEVSGKDISKTEFIDINILAEPKLYINDISYPNEIEFDNHFNASFVLQRGNSSQMKNVSVEFGGMGLKQDFFLEELLADQIYVFDLNSGDLSIKPNIFSIGITYYDLNNKLYTEYEEIEINLVNVTFSQRVVIWLHDADRWLQNLMKRI